MKHAILVAVISLLSSFAFSAPVITAVSNGSWSSGSTWDLNRVPQSGDSVVIDADRVVAVNNDVVVNGTVFIKLYGKLTFQNTNSTLNIGMGSIIVVYNGGVISGNSASQKLRLAGLNIYSGNTTVNGPVMASSLTNGSFVSISSAALPVKFDAFSATRTTNGVLVQWSTSAEVNAATYNVEKSTDGINWTVAGTVRAAGNTNTLTQYSFTDKQVAAVAYYRIKQLDIDGKAAYTTVKTVKAETVNVQVSATTGRIILQFGREASNVSVRLINLNGQVVAEQKLTAAIGQVMVPVAQKGAYVVAVSNGTDATAAQVML